METLRAMHRFGRAEGFYPLALASGLALGLLAVRMGLSGSPTYAFLVWNLFLAWLPYGTSMGVVWLHSRAPRSVWWLPLPTLGWLLFFPNAPYLVTDLVHLRHTMEFAWWFDVGMLAAFAWAGCALAARSLGAMQGVVSGVAGRVTSWLFVLAVSGLTGWGIYIGRFLRWNSWDLLRTPRPLLAEALGPLLDPRANLQGVGVTLLFAALTLVCFLTMAGPRPVVRVE